MRTRAPEFHIGGGVEKSTGDPGSLAPVRVIRAALTRQRMHLKVSELVNSVKPDGQAVPSTNPAPPSPRKHVKVWVLPQGGTPTRVIRTSFFL
ncbi:hypothetical protein D3C78_1647770 [compost metagenome]